MNIQSQAKGLKFFRLKKVVTLNDLMLYMQCSRRTVQVRLALWNALSSYNQNGSCYTLPEIAIFDVNGLWHHQGASFSRWGTLYATFARLVVNSKAGLTAAETGELLRGNPNSFLWSLRNHPDVRREKVGGRFVYYSSEETVGKKQCEQRRVIVANARIPTDFEVIAILTEKIKHPELGHKDLARRLAKQKLYIEPEVIGNLFAKHGLTVKKTPHLV